MESRVKEKVIIGHRSSGKTTYCNELFKQAPENTILFVLNEDLKHEKHRNIITYDQFVRFNSQGLNGAKNIYTILLDEYMLMPKIIKREFFNLFINFKFSLPNIKEIIYISTPNKTYPKTLFNIIKETKNKFGIRLNIVPDDFKHIIDDLNFEGKDFFKYMLDYDFETIVELYYNFATNPAIDIDHIKTTNYYSIKKIHQNKKSELGQFLF